MPKKTKKEVKEENSVCSNCWRWQTFKNNCYYFWGNKSECSRFMRHQFDEERFVRKGVI